MSDAWRDLTAELWPGDALAVLGELAVAAITACQLWQGGVARWAEVHSGGGVVARPPPDRPAQLIVAGVLGQSKIEVAIGSARV